MFLVLQILETYFYYCLLQLVSSHVQSNAHVLCQDEGDIITEQVILASSSSCGIFCLS